MDCRKFVERGCLGYTVASLSSRDDHMRQAGYHVLSRFLTHLEGARFREKNQVRVSENTMMLLYNKLSISSVSHFLNLNQIDTQKITARFDFVPDTEVYCRNGVTSLAVALRSFICDSTHSLFFS